MKQRGGEAWGDKEWGKDLPLETSQPQTTQLKNADTELDKTDLRGNEEHTQVVPIVHKRCNLQ